MNTYQIIVYYPAGVPPTLAPSKLAPSSIWSKYQDGALPVYFCFRPPVEAPYQLPAALVSPVFGRFLDCARKPVASLGEIKLESDCARDLCLEMPQKFPKESARQRVVLELLRILLGSAVEPFTIPIPGGECATTDGGLRMEVGSKNVLLLIAEFKNEIDSNCGDPLFQLLRSYELYCGSFSFDSEIRRRDVCPALAMEVVGPTLRISALACLDGNHVMAEPLTPFLHFLPVVGQGLYLDGLVAVLRALSDAVKELRDHYKAVHAAHPSDLAPVSSAARDLAIALPYPLRCKEFADVEALLPGKLVYAATHVPTGNRVCVKFTTCQNAECLPVQRAWAAAGLAPAVVDSTALPGAFEMHVMDLLPAKDGWMPLHHLSNAAEEGAARECVEQALVLAHAVDVASGADSCYRAAHGDCRDANVLVRLRPGNLAKYDVRFIDFDWAGPAGQQRYPAYMSPSSAVHWPATAFPGALLQQSHDVELLKNTQCVARRQRPVSVSPPSARLHVAGALSRVPIPKRGGLGLQRVMAFRM